MEPGKKGKLHSKNTAKHPLESTARPVPDSNGKQSLEGPIKPTENNEKLLLPNSFKQPTDTNNLKLSNKMFQDLLTNVYDLFTVGSVCGIQNRGQAKIRKKTNSLLFLTL